MICVPCRDGWHGACPEMVRREDITLTAAELAGGSWCDCQHQPRDKP